MPGRAVEQKLRRLRPLMTFIVAALFLAACGGAADDGSAAGSSTTTIGETPGTTATTESQPTRRPEISRSVYQVKADRCASPENAWTTGYAVEPQTVATVAHALISTRGVSVIDSSGVEHPVEVSYVDDEKDIALLRLPEPSALAVPPAETEPAGDVWLVTFKQKDEQPVVKPAEVLDLIEVTMDGQGARDAIKLSADISVGDSGGPVVNSDGQVLGMIFATTIDEGTGWAVAEAEVTAAVAAKNANRPEVVPPACTTDPTEPDEEPADG